MKTLLFWAAVSFMPLILLSQTPLEKSWSTYYWCNDTQKTVQKIDYEGNIILVTTVGNLRLPYAYYQQYTTVGAHKPSPNQLTAEHTDIAICKFSEMGNLLWATYYGGSLADFVNDMAIDSSGAIYLTGNARSTSAFGGITTPNCYYPVGFGIEDSQGFLAKFSVEGQLLWGTYLQGIGQSLAAEINGVHVSGFTKNVETSLILLLI